MDTGKAHKGLKALPGGPLEAPPTTEDPDKTTIDRKMDRKRTENTLTQDGNPSTQVRGTHSLVVRQENRTAGEPTAQDGPGKGKRTGTARPKPASAHKQPDYPQPVLMPGQKFQNKDSLISPRRPTVSPDTQPGIHRLATGDAYIYGRVSNDEKGTHKRTKMMVDQGNLLGAGVGISEGFFKQVNLQYDKISKSKVGTAGKGMAMTKLGTTKPFTIRLEGIQKVFQTKATVIRGLSDDINLGGGFLQQAAAKGVKTQLEFLPTGTLLHMNKETVDLVSKVIPEDEGLPIQQEKDPTGTTLEPDRPNSSVT